MGAATASSRERGEPLSAAGRGLTHGAAADERVPWLLGALQWPALIRPIRGQKFPPQSHRLPSISQGSPSARVQLG